MSDYRQPLASAPHDQQPYAQLPSGYGQPQAQQQAHQQYYPPQQQQQQPGPQTQANPQYPQQFGQPQQPYAAPQQYGQVHVPVYQANVGPCAAGGGHSIKEEFTACGLVCGILLFPIGLICCLTMKDRTCMRCGMKFD